MWAKSNKIEIEKEGVERDGVTWKPESGGERMAVGDR